MYQFKIKYILLLGVLDAIICGLLTIIFNLNGVTGIIAILCIILFNLIISIVFKIYKSNLLIYANINIVLAPLMLYISLLLWFSHQTGLKVDVKRFSNDITKYEIDINKIRNTYAIYKIVGNDYNSLKGLRQGQTLFVNDTTYLLEPKSVHKVFIYKSTLVGYPNLKDTIILNDE